MIRWLAGSRAYQWFQNLNIKTKMILVYFSGMAVLLLTLSLSLIFAANAYAQESLIQESWASIEYGNTLIEK